MLNEESLIQWNGCISCLYGWPSQGSAGAIAGSQYDFLDDLKAFMGEKYRRAEFFVFAALYFC